MTEANPFTINPIRKKEEFIGRENLISDVKNSLSRQQNCHIVGERKSGKTSFLLRMAEEYGEEGDTRFVLLDMQRLNPYTPEEILGRIAHCIDANHPEKKMENKEFEDFIRDNRYSTEHKKVILAFDEISALLKKKEVDSSFIEFLRGISGNFDIVFLTTHREGLYELTKKHPHISSPFFNVFRNFHLGYFTEEESEELIKKGGEEFLNEYKEWILEKAYYHPFLLQLTCLTLFDYHEEKKEEKKKEEKKKEEKKKEEKQVIFTSAAEEIYGTIKYHVEYWYEKCTEDEKSDLGEISSRKGKISRDEESIAQHLEKRLLIYKEADRYHLVSPFFKKNIKVESKVFDWNYFIIPLFLAFGLILSWRMKDKLFMAFYVSSILAFLVILFWRLLRR